MGITRHLLQGERLSVVRCAFIQWGTSRFNFFKKIILFVLWKHVIVFLAFSLVLYKWAFDIIHIVNFQEEYKWIGKQNTNAGEITRILESIANDTEQLEDSFYTHLEFETGGMRGIIGPGTNRMNVYTESKTAEGLAQYRIAHRE